MKDLAILRYPDGVSAKAVKSALSLHFHSRANAACVFALSIVIWLIPRVGIASEALDQKFDGVVVPCQWVQVVPHQDGVVSRILFEPGQHVSKGDILFEMEADDFALDVRMAQAELDEARARVSLAEDTAARQAILLRQNATVKQLARQSEIEVAIERAIVARKEVALAKAQLALSRTRVVAPLSGTIGQPLVGDDRGGVEPVDANRRGVLLARPHCGLGRHSVHALPCSPEDCGRRKARQSCVASRCDGGGDLRLALVCSRHQSRRPMGYRRVVD
jgi:multidrug resistance efflux pump